MSKKETKELKPFIRSIVEDENNYTDLLKSSETVTMRSGYVVLKKGESVGEHSTEDYEEMLIILEGEGEIETEGTERMKIKKGQVAYNPPHTIHNVYNLDSPLFKYIYIVART
ncbi:MAG: cupin domain-containing protein [Ignavibacteria bacterium]|jgi:quercetin dioxygenase-like cupin family protein